MLLPALPPVIRNFPPERLPITAAAVNLGFFGAAAGPLLGGVVAAAHAWRWFHAGFAGLGVVLATALFTLPDHRRLLAALRRPPRGAEQASL